MAGWKLQKQIRPESRHNGLLNCYGSKGSPSLHLQAYQQTTTMFRITLIDFIFGNAYLHICTLPVAQNLKWKNLPLQRCSWHICVRYSVVLSNLSNVKWAVCSVCFYLSCSVSVLLFNIGCWDNIVLLLLL